MVDRTSRIAEEIRKEISRIIQNDLKDPRLAPLTSITDVKVTRDLRYAKVFVSILGNEDEKSNSLTALKNAAGFIRREVGSKMQIRYTPEILFELDTSIEHGAYISKLIDDTLGENK